MGSCETPSRKTNRFLSAPCYLPKMLPSACKPAPRGAQGWRKPPPNARSIPGLLPASNAQSLVHSCCGRGTLCLLAARGQRPVTASPVPNPLLSPGAALQELGTFRGHGGRDPAALPVPEELHAKLSQGVSRGSPGAICSGETLITHSLSCSTDGVMKAPSTIKAGGCGRPPSSHSIPCSRGPGLPGQDACPGGSLLPQTRVGVGETMHHRSVSTITLSFLPWAGSCFFWKRGKQESSRGLW